MKLSCHYSNLGNNLQELFKNPGKPQNFERIIKVKHADYQLLYELLSKKYICK